MFLHFKESVHGTDLHCSRKKCIFLLENGYTHVQGKTNSDMEQSESSDPTLNPSFPQTFNAKIQNFGFLLLQNVTHHRNLLSD